MPHIERAAAANPLQSLKHGERRISGSGKDLQNPQLPVRKIDAVSKRTAGIDGYAQIVSLSYRSVTAQAEFYKNCECTAGWQPTLVL
jgi:hypothetical protein